jgi:type IV secretion system protein VirB10
MRFKMLAALTLFALFLTQTVSAVAQVAPAPATSGQQNAASSSGNLTIPAGKKIPLTLVSPIKNKSTKVGDTVRAQIAFPITSGGQIAIPAGTYVEGIVQSVNAKKTKAHTGGLQIHFTRLIFANGYTVALDAINSTAVNGSMDSEPGSWQANAGAGAGIGEGLAWLPIPLPAAYMGGQATTQTPTPAPLPGPPKGFIIAAAVMGAAMIAFFIYLATAVHHAGNSDFVVYDAGYQFQMVTSVPLSVDAAQAAAAAAVSPQ